MDMHFMSSSTEAILDVPSYAGWLSDQDHMQAYEYEKKLLKLLQWQQGGDFWVLKSPHHLEFLDVVENVFSGVKIIWMHRPIEDCIPSFFSMLYYSRLMFSDQVDKEAIVFQWTDKLMNMLQGGLKFRESNGDKIRDVFFDDFLRSEKEVVNGIAKDFSLGVSHSAFNENTEKNRYISKHKYSLEDWGIDVSQLHSTFDFYHDAIFGNNTIKQVE